MNGTTHQVTVSVSVRRDGTTLQVAGSIPVTFLAWHIKAPGGFGFLGSLAAASPAFASGRRTRS